MYNARAACWYSAICYAVLIGMVLVGCSNPAVLADGQLFCKQVHPVSGPAVVAVATLAGVPIIATGATEAFVNDACAEVDAVPVPPPAAPAPTVAISPPAP